MDFPYKMMLKRRHIVGTVGFKGSVFLRPTIEEWCETMQVTYQFDVVESEDTDGIMWGPGKSPHFSVFSVKGYVPVIRFSDEKSFILFKLRWF